MDTHGHEASLEQQIAHWRGYVARQRPLASPDVAELEDHLREQIDTLIASGLSGDEAFLVAARRLGNLDAISREFAREHSERLWKQLVMPVRAAAERSPHADAVVTFALAALSAAVVTVPRVVGLQLDQELVLCVVPFLVLPLLTAYFAWKRREDAARLMATAGAFLLAAALAILSPFIPAGQTEALALMHLPIALLPLVGSAYAGARWSDSRRRMDFVRFLGELCVYYVLTAAVGGLLVGAVAGIFRSVGIQADLELWLLPGGAAASVFIATWLVEAKQGVVENLAPVLTSIFTPFLAALLIVLLAALSWTRIGVGVDRGVLRGLLLVLVVVLAFLLFSLSARDRDAPPGLLDLAQVALVVAALTVDAVALWAIAARIHEFGFTPNRTAAIGLNLILLVNLAWSARLYVGFVRGRIPLARLETWQTDYLTVYATWAAVVAIVLPPAFGYR